MAQSQSKNSFFNKKNPIAKALKFFTHKVIRDKTKYRRQDDKIRQRELREGDGD